MEFSKVTNFFVQFLFLMLLFALPYNSIAQLTGSSWEQVLENGEGEITVLYYPEDGFAYENENGTLTGVSIDIFNQFVNFIENKHDVSLNVNYQAENNFTKLYNNVQEASNGVFGLGNVTITGERKQEVQFSPPYLTNIAVLISHSSIPTLDALNELPSLFNNMTALAFRGTMHEERINQLKESYYPNLKVEMVDSDDKLINMVSEDPSFFGYVDLSVYWMATQQDETIKRHPVGDDAAERFGFIMPLGSEWSEPMNEFFDIGSGYRSNSSYRNILVNHLGVEVTQMLQMTQQN